ncbi:TRAPP trafficking subunit Trs65-domain-containing protein [Suillus subalutaceus]|uniref:TRAPP trafficking subunit Trs65-domain-containing protein n=1 Tax=Suillus subalutaceus TaxID=48586 RepID=UPI001B85BEB8|nr:TRAPP trafficking subunit Trs65-domain-containing protein [Suillus subalutaceus]KAG1870266.1 TRAPP trafficking subunit Trs65-domain-containing protein [Suillus subalutaceus]
MSVPSFEDLFGSCTLEVIAPDTSIKFPEPGAADDWLVALKSSGIERRQAFFDEQLHLFLIAQIPCPSADVDPNDPPTFVLDFLAHVQVSLEATYISQTPTTLPETPQTARVLTPPRTSSIAKPRTTSLRPSLFPPHTPNPTPSSTEKDRKYAQSEGTLLLASIWGHRPADLSKEKFSLSYSEAKRAWLAVYELSLTVSFLRLSFLDPLLSLTVSTTLREKAVSLSQTNHPFVIFLSESGILAKLSASGITSFSKQQNQEINDVGENDQIGLEEVNLLDGLSAGSNVTPGSEPLWLPSTRLGDVTRRELFSLLPVQPSSAQQLASSPKRPPHATLRKSFRKILQTVSGFRVRMRTVFIPHILLPEMNSGTGLNDDDSDAQEREAGNNERTVVLCVEVENSGESGSGVGFSVERVDVKIGGEGASAKLIGWGEGAFEAEVEMHTFPLLIGSMEQYNLLYAVSFLKPSADSDFSLVGRRSGAAFANSDLQRAVAINIYGKPYLSKAGSEHNSEDNDCPTLTYPTHTFSSRWNCILDLSSKPPEEPLDISDPSGGARSVLPEPASPFPGQAALASAIPKVQSVTGNKRHTLPNNITAIRAINPNANFRPIPYRDQSSASPTLSNKQYTPPSVTVQNFLKSPSTTFGVPPTTPLLGVSIPNGGPYGPSESQTLVTPPTPAYPAFPLATAPATSRFQTPLSNHQGASGPSVEIRRERGLGMTAVIPQTPGPTIVGGTFDPARDPPVTGGEPIIVSVGLLPPPSGSAASRKLYPCDQFTLDIFVFNQSSWTRRFEISCPDPDRRRRRKIEQEKALRGGKTTIEELKSVMTPPGILPLQNRVRVGPLRPSTCQSVRMDFLAMTPGVHSVEILSLTDIETGFSMDLRSVLDIVVHEHHQM